MTTHAITRAAERYGLSLTERDLAAIRSNILVGNALLLSNNSDGCQVLAVIFNGVAMRLIYAPFTQSILTFLPKTAPLRKKRSQREKRPKRVWRDGRMHSVVA